MQLKKRTASPKQLLANRANARRSTGPKTGAGKARASANALKHGLTAEQIVIADEDPLQFESLCAALESECAPTTKIARRLTLQLARGLWRLRRVCPFEASIISARAAEVTPEETQTAEEYRVEKMTEIAARFAPDKIGDRDIDEPEIRKTQARDAQKFFWRKVGAALTRDSLLLDALGNLSRQESVLLTRLIRTWQLLCSFSPHLTRSEVAPPNHCEGSLAAKKIVVGDEDPTQFDGLREDLMAHYAPRTRLQYELIDYIVGLYWRLERVPNLEAALMGILRDKVAPDEIDDATQRAQNKEFERLSRKWLRKAGLAVPKKAENKNTTVSKIREPVNTVAGLVLIEDSRGQGALRRLSYHEAALMKGLSRASKFLSDLSILPKGQD